MIETIFENTGDWTPLSSEGVWLDEVAATAPAGRVTVETIGVSSIDGYDLRKVVISNAQAGAPTLLFIGGVHGGNNSGGEPAGREAMLTFIRDMAFSNSAIVAWLRNNVNIVVIPTVNPVGVARGVANAYLPNNTSRSIQSDVFTMRLNENVAVFETVNLHRPVFMLDCHEYFSSSSSRSVRIRPTGINPDPELYETSLELYNFLTNYLNTRDIDVDLFDQSIGRDYRSYRNTLSLAHLTGFLIETPHNDRSPFGRSQRMDLYKSALDGMLSWLRNNIEKLVIASGHSYRALIHNIKSRETQLDLRAEHVLETYPMGYSQLPSWPKAFTVLDIVGDVDSVSTSQWWGLYIMRAISPHTYQPIMVSHEYNPEPPPEPSPGTVINILHEGEKVVSAKIGSRSVLT